LAKCKDTGELPLSEVFVVLIHIQSGKQKIGKGGRGLKKRFADD
jgi:hypothetical protein